MRLAFALFSLFTAVALAAPARAEPDAPAVKTDPKPEKAVAATPSDGQLYCQAIATAATDARVAWETKKLAEAEAQIKQRLADLAAKQAEVQSWIDKRDAFLKQADEGVLAVYNKMKPEAAAAQIALMDEPVAASILTKMSVRTASAIMNEMTADRAARLAAAMRAVGNQSGKS